MTLSAVSGFEPASQRRTMPENAIQARLLATSTKPGSTGRTEPRRSEHRQLRRPRERKAAVERRLRRYRADLSNRADLYV